MSSAPDSDSLLPDPRRGFEGKVALITGSSRGIGRALALRLAARGATPIINYKVNQEAAAQTVAEIQRLGSGGMAIRADLESIEEIEAMFDQVQERYGRLDFFISNASASNFHHFMDLKPHHLERTFNLNVRAFVVGTQRAVRLMPSEGGRVVVLSSYGSIRSFPTYANLGSAKAAIETWARYMAVELAPLGVNVNAVNGGIIETDSSSYFYSTGLVPSLETVLPKIPKRRMGTAAEVAALARGGVRHRDDADRRRRPDRDRATVPLGYGGSGRRRRARRAVRGAPLGTLAGPVARATTGFLEQDDLGDLGPALDPLDHVVDGQRRHRGGRHRLHLDPGLACGARFGGQNDRAGVGVDGALDANERERERMAQRDELGRPLGGLDAGDPGHAEDVALRRIAGENLGRGLGRDPHHSPRHRPPLGSGLLAHVDHPGAARGIQMGEVAHRAAGALKRCASAIRSRTACTSPSRSSSIGSGSPLTIDSKNTLRS